MKAPKPKPLAEHNATLLARLMATCAHGTEVRVVDWKQWAETRAIADSIGRRDIVVRVTRPKEPE